MRTQIALLCLILFLLSAASIFAQTQMLDFEDFAGPSRFDSVQAPVRQLSATFSGGEVLRNSPLTAAGKNAVYGTSSTCSGCFPAISIRFNQGVSDVKIFLTALAWRALLDLAEIP